jgi:phosphate/sulfate permease
VHGRKAVRWGVVGEIAMSWMLTLPATIFFGYLFATLVRAVNGGR